MDSECTKVEEGREPIMMRTGHFARQNWSVYLACTIEIGKQAMLALLLLALARAGNSPVLKYYLITSFLLRYCLLTTIHQNDRTASLTIY